MDAVMLDRLRIREMIENWVLWRDAGDWERFRTVWHPDARMMATWFQGPAEQFIEVSREGWAKGVSILHFLGGSSIDVSGDVKWEMTGTRATGAAAHDQADESATGSIVLHVGPRREQGG